MEENNEVSAGDYERMSDKYRGLKRQNEVLGTKNEERNGTNIHMIEEAIDNIKINRNNDNEKASTEKHFRHEETKKQEILKTNNKDELLKLINEDSNIMNLEVDIRTEVNNVDLGTMRREELTGDLFDDSKINKEKAEPIEVIEDVNDETKVNVEIEINKQISDEVNINKVQPSIYLDNDNKEDLFVKVMNEENMLKEHFEDDMKMNEKAILNGKIDAEINYENTKVDKPIKQVDIDINETKMNTEKTFKIGEFNYDHLEIDINSYDSDEDNDYKTESVNYRKLILMNMLSCINVEEYLPIFEQYNITHETLRLLEEDDLEVMGITDRNHVVELLNHIRSLPPLQRLNHYELFDEPLLNKDVLINFSKHLDLLTLSLKNGLEVSCCINDINCKKPQYRDIHNPIIYPEGIKSSQIAMDTAKYVENKLDELNTELDNSKKLWGIKKLPKTRNNVRKNFEKALPCFGIVTLTFLSCILLGKVIKSL